MYCYCGCGEITQIIKKTDLAQGRIKGQHNHFINGHHNRLPRPDRRLGLDRWVEQDRGYMTPCHVWIGPINRGGRGFVREPDTGRTRDAHVVIWEAEHGAVPEGKELDHLCRVRACVRTDHLEPVTHIENMRRSPITKMTLMRAAAIRASTDSYGVLARRYSVSESLIGQIRRGERWVC